MERIKTNIIKRENFVPDFDTVMNKCTYTEKKYIVHYSISPINIIDYNILKLLEKYTNIDIVGYFIDDNSFNWKDWSDIIVTYSQEYFDPNKFNWLEFSDALIRFCPEYFDPDKYNWNDGLWVMADQARYLLDRSRYIYKYSKYAILLSCPEYGLDRYEDLEI